MGQLSYDNILRKDYVAEKCIKYPGAKFGILEICIWDSKLQIAKIPSALCLIVQNWVTYMYCVQFIH